MNASHMKCITALFPTSRSRLLALVFLTSCASEGGDMKAFVGQPSSELIARLGPPKLRIPEGQGGQIWTYVDQRVGPGAARVPYPGALNSSAAGAGAASHTSALDNPAFTSKKEFYIDASGMIYKYRGSER